MRYIDLEVFVTFDTNVGQGLSVGQVWPQMTQKMHGRHSNGVAA